MIEVKARDTMMRYDGECPSLKKELFDEICKLQAELTWGVAFEEGRKVRIREVMEWTESHRLSGSLMHPLEYYQFELEELREFIPRLLAAAKAGECPEPDCKFCKEKWETIKKAEAKLKEWLESNSKNG